MTGLRPGIKIYIRAFATTKEGVTTYVMKFRLRQLQQQNNLMWHIDA
jgi:hypothetical protein